MQIDEVITAPHSPFQNPYAERVIGSIRRECLDHLIVQNEDHLRRILRAYFNYYHDSRPHQSLERNSSTPREIESTSQGKIIAIPQVGGLHHRYRRAAYLQRRRSSRQFHSDRSKANCFERPLSTTGCPNINPSREPNSGQV